MTDKELHKLGRRELLQLMLAQGREAEKAKQELAETQDKLSRLEEGYERLKNRLDDKDAQIHKLRAALQSAQGEAGMMGVSAMPAQDDYYAPPQAAVQQRPAPQVQQAQAPPQQLMPAAMQPPPVQQPTLPPAQAPPAQPPVQPARAAPQQARRPTGDYGEPPGADIPVAGRHSRKEQEYYDYLFGPVPNQGQAAQQLRRERPRPQSPPQPVQQPQPYREQPPREAQPYREPQHFREPQPRQAEPRPQQWAPPPQYEAAPQQAGYMPQQYGYPAYQKAPPQPVPLQPEPVPPAFQPAPAQPVPEPASEPYYPSQGADEFIPVPDSAPEPMQTINAVEIVNGLPVSRSQVLRPRR